MKLRVEGGVKEVMKTGGDERGWSLRSLVIKVIKHFEIGGNFLGQ